MKSSRPMHQGRDAGACGADARCTWRTSQREAAPFVNPRRGPAGRCHTADRPTKEPRMAECDFGSDVATDSLSNWPNEAPKCAFSLGRQPLGMSCFYSTVRDQVAARRKIAHVLAEKTCRRFNGLGVFDPSEARKLARSRCRTPVMERVGCCGFRRFVASDNETPLSSVRDTSADRSVSRRHRLTRVTGPRPAAIYSALVSVRDDRGNHDHHSARLASPDSNYFGAFLAAARFLGAAYPNCRRPRMPG